MPGNKMRIMPDVRMAKGRAGLGPVPPLRWLGLRAQKPVKERLLDPEVVTEEPAEDDAEVYGDAWPLVEEWRELRAGHPHQGKSLSWLVTEERLLTCWNWRCWKTTG